jgi:hypothetical protein
MSQPYLYRNQNPHAPKRANGRRFWGYPSRPAGAVIDIIGVHTAENPFDQMGQDTGAEGVAAFQSRTERPSSYHRIADRDSTVTCLPDEAVAFGIANRNRRSLHVSLALRAADWSDPDKAARAEPTLRRAAAVVAAWCRRYDIPPRRITRAQADAGVRGLLAHGDADPGRRSDPGVDFPWDRFLTLIRQLLAGATSTEEIDMMQPDTKKYFDEKFAKLSGGPRVRDRNGKVVDNDPSVLSEADTYTLVEESEQRTLAALAASEARILAAIKGQS